MSIEKWSETIVMVHAGDDPLFSEDMEAVHQLSRPITGVVLDFDAVHFVNSSNIAALLRVRQTFIERDIRLMLCNVRDKVLGTFTLTGLDKIFHFSENVPTALATLQMREARNK